MCYGGYHAHLRNLEGRLQELEKQDQVPTYHPITPNARPDIQGGMDLILEADFTYLTPRLNALTYAQTGRGDLADGVSVSKGNVYAVDWRWDPGFKTALGWNIDHGGWDVILRYTWLYSKATGGVRASHLLPTFDILPPDLSFLVFKSIDFAHANWYFHNQVGDLELGRNYYVHRFLKLRPFIGFKGMWQTQQYHVFYDSIQGEFSFNNVSGTFSFGLQSRDRQMVWGIGTRMGLDTSWQFNDYVALYGDFALTGMWTHYHVDRTDTFVLVDDVLVVADLNLQLDKDIEFVNLQADPHFIQPIIELGIGLRLESGFGSRGMHMLFQVGWESQIWINQALYISTDNHFDRFDLDIYGLVVRLRFDF